MNIFSNRHYLLAMTLFLLMNINLVHADVLELEDGSVVVGNYVDGTTDFILFEVDGNIVAYPVGDVKTMGLSDAQPAKGQNSGPVIVPRGTRLLIRTNETVNSKQHKAGHMFSARLEGDLAVDGVLVAHRGARVYGRITESRQGGNIGGKSVLGLQLTDLTVDGKPQQIATSSYKAVTKGEGQRTLQRTLGAAAIGGLLKGSKGAKRGAKVGAGVSILTGGQQIGIPAGTVLEFTLVGDLVIR